MEITKRFNWHCSHRLNKHDGNCSSLHGHTYEMEVTLKSSTLKDGMIEDFGNVKKLVNKRIVNQIDHSVVFGIVKDSGDRKLLNLCKEQNWRYIEFPIEYTTAEHMAHHFLFLLREDDKRIIGVKLWETPTSYAEAKI